MWWPILVYTGIFVTLFVTHIIAAANDFDMLFRLVAGLITLQTLLAGLCLHFLGGDVKHARFPLVALSAGLGWAYADMSFAWSIAIWMIVAGILQILTEKGLKYNTPAQRIDG
tara:strand:- start:1025 stop:1363 length:339 start_codon:yes stop_codon:yes gene_type:complete